MAIVKLAPSRLCSPEGSQAQMMGNIDWLVSCIPGNESEVISGKDGGMLLSNYINSRGLGCMGEDAAKYQVFPYTAALIQDANNALIQMNPYKTRESIWYVADAKEGAAIDFGLENESNLDEVKDALKEGTIHKLLKKVPVKTGDVFEVEAGCMFALNPDVKIIDIQKAAATEPMSQEEALGNMILKPVSHDHHDQEWLQDGQATYSCLGKNDVFDVDLYELNGRIDMDADSRSCKALIFVDGSAVIDSDGEILHAEKDNAFFVEAGTYPFQITGNCKFLLVTLV